MSEITIGTCGYSYYDAPEGWKDRYESKLAAFADAFECVEINRTFYSLPQVSTTERWRREVDGVNSDFTFAVKAWQAITHPISSPTWRGNDDDLSEAEREQVGMLQPNSTVVEAWNATRARAEALEAEVVVVQTPPSFDCSDEHATNLRGFVDAIDRGGLEIAWEPRGNWAENLERVAALCEDLELIHVTDLMREEPLATTDTAYTRLHGLNEDRYDYDYDYSDEELEELAEGLDDLAGDHEHVYCLFNNYAMYDNAETLAGLL
jgi:uncharacterized protein YecE (DUF72 family)